MTGQHQEQEVEQSPHPERRDQVREAVPQVGVVSEGVVREQGRHAGTPLGSVEDQHQHCNVWQQTAGQGNTEEPPRNQWRTTEQPPRNL